MDAVTPGYLTMLRPEGYPLMNPQTDLHGLLVVGWGPIENCSTAVTTRRNITHFTESRTTALTVPYVADFASVIPSIARPFYCTMYNDQTDTLDHFEPHNWYVYRLPDSVTLTIDPAQPTYPSPLYVDPEWAWTSTDG
jgi:hypothetical protein